DFVQLMIAELQNQDPLNPMDNAQMLDQIGQIREIGSNDKLSSTLEALMLGQGINMASGMLGQKVSALSDEAKRIEGVVNRVMIEGNEAKLIVTETVPEATDPETNVTTPEHTVNHTVSVNNINEVLLNDTEDTLDSTETDNLPAMISAARELIGQSILGISQGGKAVTGEVKRVSMEDGAPMLILSQHIPAKYNPVDLTETSPAKNVDHKISLADISKILSEHVDTAVVSVE
ncbi:MAG: flagellar hook capping FlgD N-terminal domain-containing protein, partial [Planctomycetota bacterium]|nr:flagellar hook capping FlgD N-terminal domain-containing protein [Planctomycetota bacterium]